MISQDIKYTNFIDGQEVTKTFWFHLTRLEVAEIHLADDLAAVVAAEDPIRSLQALKRLLRHAVCLRNGDRISKPESLGDEFVASDAYSEFIFELMQAEDGAERMAKFIKAVAPFIDKGAPQDFRPSAEEAPKNISKKGK